MRWYTLLYTNSYIAGLACCQAGLTRTRALFEGTSNDAGFSPPHTQRLPVVYIGLNSNSEGPEIAGGSDLPHNQLVGLGPVQQRTL